MRISVPRRSSSYDEELQKAVLSLDPGDVHTFELESEAVQSPNWRIAAIDPDAGPDSEYKLTA